MGHRPARHCRLKRQRAFGHCSVVFEQAPPPFMLRTRRSEAQATERLLKRSVGQFPEQRELTEWRACEQRNLRVLGSGDARDLDARKNIIEIVALDGREQRV